GARRHTMNAKEEAITRNQPESQEFKNLKQDLDVLRKDLAKLSNTLFTEAKTGAESVLEGLNKQSSRVVHQAESKIAERPLLSLLIGFLLGLVLAKALEHRSND